METSRSVRSVGLGVTEGKEEMGYALHNTA